MCPSAPDFQSNLESHIQGAVVCTACDSVYRVDDYRLSCGNCNAPLKLAEESRLPRPRRDVGTYMFLKPLGDSISQNLRSVGHIVDAGGPSLKNKMEGRVCCGWCAREYTQRPESANCETCGGVLPFPPGIDPGPEPPAAPRQLPRGFAYRLFVRQNFGGWFGVGAMMLSLPLICVLGPFALLVFLFGLVVGHSNFLMAYRRYQALRSGASVLGKIESVELIGDPKQGKPMFRVFFRFDVGDQPLRGMKYTYDMAITNHFVGQPVWVVYQPPKSAGHDLWPPLA